MPREKLSEQMTHEYHRFIDEAGDMTFFGKGKVSLLGSKGVSKVFMLGMVHVKRLALPEARQAVSDFVPTVCWNSFFNVVPSINKRIASGGMYLHSKDNPAELRYKFFEFLRTEMPFTLQVVVGRKDLGRFVGKHNSREKEFYVDLLAHLLEDKGNHSKLVLNVATLGNVTRMKTLEDALVKASERHLKAKPDDSYKAKVVFNLQPYSREPLLAIADYSLWVVQRVFERGETRFYDLIVPKVRWVTDLYAHSSGPLGNIYTPRKPLTMSNLIE